MRQKTFIGLVVFFWGMLIMLGGFGCQKASEPELDPIQPEIRIGYCPTMAPVIQALLENQIGFRSVGYENSALVMQALHSGTIHAAIIGRGARVNELSEDLNLVRLKDGFTIIAMQPSMIRYDDLHNITMYTLEDENVLRTLLPDGTPIQTFQDYTQMVSSLDESAAIIMRWSDVSPNDNLLIPVDQQGNKISTFRSPHFYYKTASKEALLTLLDMIMVND